MHRWTWAIAFVTACVYSPPPGDPVDPDDPDDPDPQTINGACFAQGTLLCLEFESNDMVDGFALDGSGNHHDATRMDVAEITRLMTPVPSDPGAAGFGPTSRMSIDKELGLSGSVTVEMWSMGFSNRTIFDSSGRLYLSRNSEGVLECGINGGVDDQRVDGGTRLDELNWHHVACVFDATTREIRVYVDGDVDDCKDLDTTIDTSRTGTTTLGAGFLGAIDSVHVFPRALTSSDICTSAGRGTTCRTQCPTEGGGGPGGPGGPGGGFDD